MRRVLLYLVQLAIIVAAAIWLAEQPGEVRIDWFGWRIETSAAVLLLIVLALAWVLAVLRGIWKWLRRAPGRFVEARRERRREEGYEALGRGLAAVAAGDAQEARRFARKASTLLDEPPLTRLLTAQAAQLGGDEKEAARQFQAMRDDPATEFVGLRGLLAKALRDNDRGQALALAERALELKPTAPWLLKQTFALQAEAGSWRKAMVTLADAAGRGAIEKETARRARTALLVALAGETDDALEAKHLTSEATELAPGFAPAAVKLAELHAAAGSERRAIKTLERAWASRRRARLAGASRRVRPARSSPLAAAADIDTRDPCRVAARARRGGARRPALGRGAPAAPRSCPGADAAGDPPDGAGRARGAGRRRGRARLARTPADGRARSRLGLQRLRCAVDSLECALRPLRRVQLADLEAAAQDPADRPAAGDADAGQSGARAGDSAGTRLQRIGHSCGAFFS